MPESVDSRTPVAVATSGLSGDIRRILERLTTAGVQAVQLSTGQRGTSPRDLDRSGRQDLGVVIRRRELRLAGLDHVVDPDQLLAPDGVDVAATVVVVAAVAVVFTFVVASAATPAASRALLVVCSRFTRARWSREQRSPRCACPRPFLPVACG